MTTSALIQHIQLINKQTQDWVDSGEGRWAGMLSEDPAHWAESGIHTIDDFERDRLITDISECHKAAYGYRPRHINYSALTLVELQRIADEYAEAAHQEFLAEEQRQKENLEQFEKEISNLMSLGAKDRETAIRWFIEGMELSESDLMYGSEYICWSLDIAYSCEQRKEFDIALKAIK